MNKHTRDHREGPGNEAGEISHVSSPEEHPGRGLLQHAPFSGVENKK